MYPLGIIVNLKNCKLNHIKSGTIRVWRLLDQSPKTLGKQALIQRPKLWIGFLSPQEMCFCLHKWAQARSEVRHRDKIGCGSDSRQTYQQRCACVSFHQWGQNRGHSHCQCQKISESGPPMMVITWYDPWELIVRIVCLGYSCCIYFFRDSWHSNAYDWFSILPNKAFLCQYWQEAIFLKQKIRERSFI